jgi:hypothetical protein
MSVKEARRCISCNQLYIMKHASDITNCCSCKRAKYRHKAYYLRKMNKQCVSCSTTVSSGVYCAVCKIKKYQIKRKNRKATKLSLSV